MNRRSLLTFGRRSGFVRAGRRRGVQAVALLSAGMLVVSGLSITALTAGIQTSVTAIGQPAHDMHEDGVRRRGPVPRAAFPALPARGPAVFGGDRVYDIDVNGTSYRVHKFTTVGSSSLTVTRSIDVEYLVVAGGGGGGSGAASDHAGGGGGAGGVLHGTLKLSGSSTVPVVVGNGGSGGGDGGAAGARAAGSNGGNSAFADVVAVGGGGGGNSATNGGDGANEGGSGGGGAALVASLGTTQTGQGAAGTSGQGNRGGDGETASSPKKAGGGGGATAAGASGASSSDGGQGFSSSITGTSRVYGAGGGGGRDTKSGAGGSFTGPGMGGTVENRGAGTPGAAGSGAGGGGGSGGGGSAIDAGGAGGSGIVVVRYQIPRTTWASVGVTGGNTVTDTTIDGELYREHRFTGTGNHTLALSIENPSTQLDVLIVGGGGGGGADSGGGGGGGALLEGRLTFAEAGNRTLTVTVGAGGGRGRWTSPGSFAGTGGNSRIVVTRGQTTEVNATAQGGRGGPKNDQLAINTSNNATGAGGATPSTPTLNGATWQTVTARAGGKGGDPSATGYQNHAPGRNAPAGGGGATLFSGAYGGGGGGGSSGQTLRSLGTNGGGRGSGTNTSTLNCNLRATAGAANTGGGGGGGAAYGPSGSTCAGSLNTRDAEPGGSGIVIIRYPLTRTITALPTAVRELVAAEGNTTAQLRFKPPTNDPPAVNSSGYKIEYSPVSGATWTMVTTPVTFTTTGSGATQVITADVTGIPSGSRHRFRVTPIGTVDGPSATTEPLAKGGDVVWFVGDDVVHQYTTVGNANFALSEPRTVEALVVGGGGGGGGRSGGGGGAGGVVDRTGTNAVAMASGSYAIVVGGGGAGGAGTGVTGTNGSNSTAFSLTALGGGGGGSDDLYSGREGGSGGGGRYGFNGAAATQPTSASQGLGHSGGSGTPWNTYMGGGGGGAGGPGVNGTTTVVGDGGPGVNFASVFGASVGANGWFAGGGGGGSHKPSPTSAANWGFGGVGGGGNGGQCVNCAGSAGTANTGGGGGAGSTNTFSGGAGGAGGSGTVILRYSLVSSPGVGQLAAAETFTSALLRFVEPSEGAPARTADSYQIEYAQLGQGNWTVITPTSFTATDSGVITATVAPPQNANRYQFRVAPIVSTAQGVLVGPGRVAVSAGKGGDTLTVITSNNQTYFVHSYTQTGTTSFAISNPLAVEYLVVAGGGGGGYGNANEGGGGGGAGGLLTNLGAPSTIGSGGPQSFPVTVGAGGAGATATTTSATSGQNSVFASWTAAGGGGGGSCSSEARQGGSGGGGSGCARDRPGATASPAGQGHNGGSGQWIENGPGNGGGGGGAGGAGGDGSARSGPSTGGGGAGAANTITGSSVVYAAGGHGFEGRGNRGETRGVGAQGTDGLGNGGAGSAQQNGARGGSGIVVIRYVAVETS